MALTLLHSHRNLSTEELTLTLPKSYIKDPLGLGLARPPAPADPDIFNLERENNEFSRSLLTKTEIAELDKELSDSGYMTIDQVRALVNANTSKMPDDTNRIDPEMIAAIDQRINYKIYIDGGNIFVRNELYDNYAFHEFGVQPESFFIQQELGVFNNAEGVEYISRDIGDESVKFICTRDLVQQECFRKPGFKPKPPTAIVKTKIYVGREAWKDFISMQSLYRCQARINPESMIKMITGAAAPNAEHEHAEHDYAEHNHVDRTNNIIQELRSEVDDLKRIVREMQIFLGLV